MEIDSNEDYIEEYIQDKYKVMVPVLKIETNKPNMKWENEDLKEFFSKFGNISRIEISANIASSKEDVDKLTSGMNKFSNIVQDTFEQLQNLKEVATSDD